MSETRFCWFIAGLAS